MAYAALCRLCPAEPAAGDLWPRSRTLAADLRVQRRLPRSAPSAAAGHRLRDDREAGRLRSARDADDCTLHRTRPRMAHGLMRSPATNGSVSVPVADGFFTLAQDRIRRQLLCSCRACCPTAAPTAFFIQRLKDKCGNRSNASSEIEYHDTWSILVGEEGRGIREILSHAHLTRLDFAAGSAGLMRQALSLALNHAQTRTAFGKPIVRAADADAMCSPTSRSRARRRCLVRCASRVPPTAFRPANTNGCCRGSRRRW